MKTVAIIAEYNPFHNGHMHHIDMIRRDFGNDTAIVAIMSGSFTQRAEPAIADKYARAEAAVRCGVSLVLELPFPHSVSSAAYFASCGVHIVSSLGCIDAISFGSECADASMLSVIADRMCSPEYGSEIKAALAADENRGIGYPAVCEKVYTRLYGSLPEGIFSPNNILGIEYIKALRERGSDIMPHTVRRTGGGYNETDTLPDTGFQSAAALRRVIADGGDISPYIPKESYNVLMREALKGRFPADGDRLSPAVISKFRLSDRMSPDDYPDGGSGLYNRLFSSAAEANNISSLIRLSETKKYTRARVRRGICYHFFGVTSSEVNDMPTYALLLAADEKGQKILKNVKKTTGFRILTKPSSCTRLDRAARASFERRARVDSVYELCLPVPGSAPDVMRRTPFVKKA